MTGPDQDGPGPAGADDGGPVLDPAESQAIAQAMRAAPAPTPAPQRVDLAGGDRLLRALCGPLAPLGPRYAERARAVIARTLRLVPAVTPEPFEIVSGARLRAELERAPAIGVLTVQDTAQAYLALDPALAFWVVERRFGGVPGAAPPPDRPLTALERRLVSDLVKALVAELTPSSADLGGLRFALERVESRLDAASLPGDGAALLCVFGIAAGTLSASLRLILPAAALDPLRHWAAVRPSGGAPSRDIARVLRGAEVEVCAVMGGTTLDLAGLVALRAGDVIRLDTPEGSPITVTVEGAPKLRGRPVIAHGNLAVEILQPA